MVFLSPFHFFCYWNSTFPFFSFSEFHFSIFRLVFGKLSLPPFHFFIPFPVFFVPLSWFSAKTRFHLFSWHSTFYTLTLHTNSIAGFFIPEEKNAAPARSEDESRALSPRQCQSAIKIINNNEREFFTPSPPRWHHPAPPPPRQQRTRHRMAKTEEKNQKAL